LIRNSPSERKRKTHHIQPFEPERRPKKKTPSLPIKYVRLEKEETHEKNLPSRENEIKNTLLDFSLITTSPQPCPPQQPCRSHSACDCRCRAQQQTKTRP
jgi:hypothetical protein